MENELEQSRDLSRIEIFFIYLAIESRGGKLAQGF